MGYGVTAAQTALGRLGAAIRDAGWQLALEVVEEGLAGDAVPVLARLDRVAQLGDMPTFSSELAHELG